MSAPVLPCTLAQSGGWTLPDGVCGEEEGALAPEYGQLRALLRPTSAAEADWERACLLSANILATFSKDLGVATDLAIALWMARDLDGLAEAIEIWLGLLREDVLPQVWPRDREGRLAHARAFLERITGLARALPELTWSRKRRRAVALNEALDQLRGALERTFGAEACERDLYELTRVLLRNRGEATQPLPPSGDQPWQAIRSALLLGEMNLEDAAGRADPVIGAPIIERLRDPIFLLCRALLQSAPGLASAWRLTRAILWGLVEVPSPRGGALAADAALSELHLSMGRLQAARGALPAWEIELLWQERPWTLWLDPHRVAAEVSRSAGHAAAAAAIEGSVSLLLARGPAAPKLRFDDPARTRLADEQTQRWAAHLVSASAQGAPRVRPDPFQDIDARDLTKAGDALLSAVRRTLRDPAGAGAKVPPPARVVNLLDPLLSASLSFLRACDPLDPAVMSLHLSWFQVRALAPCVDARGIDVEGVDPGAHKVVDLTELRDTSGEVLERLPELFATLERNPLFLDLYPLLAEACAAAGRPDAAQVVEACAWELTRSVPGLLELRSADGEPQTSDTTRAWLEELDRRELARRSLAAQAEEGTESTSLSLSSQAHEVPSTPNLADVVDPWAAGLSLLREGELTAGLASLAQVARACSGDRVRFEGELRMVEVLTELGRPDLARPLLDALDARAREFHLDRWEPDLALAPLRARAALLERHPEEPPVSMDSELSRLRRRAAELGHYPLLQHNP